MSITSRLFQKAVKVLRGGRGNASRKTAARKQQEFQVLQNDGFGTGSPFFEQMESRLLLTTVSIAAGLNAAEGGADGSFIVTRDDAAGDLTVNFTVKGLAKLGANKDYTLNDGTNNLTTSVVIPNGQNSVTINVVDVDDAFVEPTEEIIITLKANSAYDLTPNFPLRAATINLLDNEPEITVTATDTTLSEEGDAGIFTITRTGNTTGDLTVNFTLNGKAKLGATKDFTLNDGTDQLTKSVIIRDGQATATINVIAFNDAIVEPTENIILNLKASKTYNLSPDFSTRTATMNLDDNEPIVVIAPTDGNADEDGDTGTFTISRIGSTNGEMVVKFQRSGNAKFGRDYFLTVNGVNLTAREITLADGVASVDIVVVPIGPDATFESTEDVSLTLKKSKAYHLNQASSAAVLIEDNTPFIFAEPISSQGSESIFTTPGLRADAFVGGTDPDGLLRLRFGENADATLAVNSFSIYLRFNVADFANVDDLVKTDLVLTLVDVILPLDDDGNPIIDPKTLEFDLYGLIDGFDPIDEELDELWGEGAINSGNAPGGLPPLLVPDPPPSPILHSDGIRLTDMFGNKKLSSSSINTNATGLDSDEPGNAAELRFSGSGILDYIKAESDDDGNEFITFILVGNFDPSNFDRAIFRFDSADDNGTFIDDPDNPGELRRVDNALTAPKLVGTTLNSGAQVVEGDDNIIKIFRSGSFNGDVTVNFKLTGDAKLGVDFTLDVIDPDDGITLVPIFDSFVFPEGEDVVEINVRALNDALFEIPETFELTIVKGGYSFNKASQSSTMTVLENRPVVSVEATNPIGREPGGGASNLVPGTFTISRTGGTLTALEVQVKITGSAVEGTDYLSIGRTVIIPVGQASVEIDVIPITDFIPEGTETVTLNIVESSLYGINWEVDGNRTTTGNPLRTRTVAASNIKDVLKVAKQQNIGSPIVEKGDQVATVSIFNRTPDDGIDLMAIAFQLANKTIDNDTNGGTLGTVSIHNRGNRNAGTFNVRFFLSEDRTLDTGSDFLLSTQAIPNLAAASSTQLSLLFGNLATLGAGQYFLIADVDADVFVIETISDNNTLITVTPEITVVD